MDFADRVVELQRARGTVALLGLDPQLDKSSGKGLPEGYSLLRFCCEIIEACAPYVIGIKPNLAFFEARGISGMETLVQVLRFARSRNLLTIADGKRGDIGSSSEAYAEAFLGNGEFSCDAVTVNPYLGSDALAPFVTRVKTGRGLFVLVRTSNPSAGEFQDLSANGRPLWELVADRVRGWGEDFIGRSGLSSVGAVVGATYPDEARRCRQLLPAAPFLVPGYGAQGASAADAIAGTASRGDFGPGLLVNASRALMYAFRRMPEVQPGEAAAAAARKMRDDLNDALRQRGIEIQSG